jgi:hypothetical protein
LCDNSSTVRAPKIFVRKQLIRRVINTERLKKCSLSSIRETISRVLCKRQICDDNDVRTDCRHRLSHTIRTPLKLDAKSPIIFFTFANRERTLMMGCRCAFPFLLFFFSISHNH